MRFAIYFLPDEHTPLWRFGSSVIGYDAVAGDAVAHPALDGVDLAAITREPRTYGFHATLKAPFRLAANTDDKALLAAAKSFAKRERPISIGSLNVRALGSFIALVPDHTPRLDRFAARCVEDFERYRAPINAQERAKRLRAPLTPRQIYLMDAYGYPYVLDEFRFHLTLTSTLDTQLVGPALSALSALYETVAEPVRIASICVCVQAPGQNFRLLTRLPLGA
jgi:putative phosphonate metabolism protein